MVKRNNFGRSLRQQIALANNALALDGIRRKITRKELAIRINSTLGMVVKMLYYGAIPSNGRMVDIANALWKKEESVIQCLEQLLLASGLDKGSLSISYNLSVPRQKSAIGPMARDLALELHEQSKEKA